MKHMRWFSCAGTACWQPIPTHAQGLLCEIRELQVQGHVPPPTPAPRLGLAEARDPGSAGSDMLMDALSP